MQCWPTKRDPSTKYVSLVYCWPIKRDPSTKHAVGVRYSHAEASLPRGVDDGGLVRDESLSKIVEVHRMSQQLHAEGRSCSTPHPLPSPIHQTCSMAAATAARQAKEDDEMAEAHV